MRLFILLAYCTMFFSALLIHNTHCDGSSSDLRENGATRDTAAPSCCTTMMEEKQSRKKRLTKAIIRKAVEKCIRDVCSVSFLLVAVYQSFSSCLGKLCSGYSRQGSIASAQGVLCLQSRIYRSSSFAPACAAASNNPHRYVSVSSCLRI